MARFTWHGHACFTLEAGGTRILFDPYLENNPKFDGSYDDFDGIGWILVSHGHFDHFEDVVPLAKKTGATVVSSFEIAAYCEGQGVEKTHKMSIGGAHGFPFGRVKMTPALHGGHVDGPEPGMYAPPGGFLIDLEDGPRFWYSGDTALSLDMQLLRDKVDVAVLPIGDNFTMGPDDAARAVDFVRPGKVIPIHYDTWPLIAQDPNAFAGLVGDRAEVVVVAPGETVDL